MRMPPVMPWPFGVTQKRFRYRGDSIDRSHDPKPPRYELAHLKLCIVDWPFIPTPSVDLVALEARRHPPEWDRDYRIESDEREKE